MFSSWKLRESGAWVGEMTPPFRPLAPPARVRPSMSTHATPRWFSQ